MTEHINVDGASIEVDVLAGLKPFQQATVHHVFQRMYLDAECTSRFLVADEVGLGKTLVARGVIARTIRHLQEQGRKRIDIVYICSNADIATQNVRRLNVTGREDFSLATRITLLPRQLHRLAANGVNFVSFTPGTSFNMVSQSGRAEERAVLFRLLEFALGTSLDLAGAYRTLKAGSQDANFRRDVSRTPSVGAAEEGGLDVGLAEAFRCALHEQPDLIQAFLELASRPTDGSADQDWRERINLIGRLRETLAKSCIDALRPSLVILDEFQRFRELLTEPDPNEVDNVRFLAHHLFQQQGARTLLLSATPYKMYSLNAEEDDDHYADFLRTARFLMGQEEVAALADDLRDFRLALIQVSSGDYRRLKRYKLRIEHRLRRFIARTERLAASDDASAMLEDHLLDDTQLTPPDVRTFAALDRLAHRLDAGDVMEYWKSSPYLLNFMSDYELKRSLRESIDDPTSSRELATMIPSDTLLNRRAIESYAPADAGNARVRGLLAETIDPGAWRLLWLPPSLPYYRGSGAYIEPQLDGFTKRLIFSSWTVVPDAIALLTSYQAERQMMLTRDKEARNTPEDRARLRGLLAIRRQGDQPAGMTTLAFLYPSLVLARELDPLKIARQLGVPEKVVDKEAMLQEAEHRIAQWLEPYSRRAAKAEGSLIDQRWYWAAPLLIDRRWKRIREPTLQWFHSKEVAHAPGTSEGTRDEDVAWADHLERAREVMRHGERYLNLGRMPSDLPRALAQLALGGPGTCALRALGRVLGGPDIYSDPSVRTAALLIAWGFRTLYNVPEVMALLRGEVPEDAYWRRAAEEGVDGNLQAVLDEYLHILPDALGLANSDRSTAASTMAKTIQNAVGIRAVNYGADDVTTSAEGMLQLIPRQMRARFALRFGRDASDDKRVLMRSQGVRAAFNSPFWPFILASTSVGQEGLDFHQYCHAVVHWNLPANPVDLEQREGRVHRFKGHAIRKNVAAAHHHAAFAGRLPDPWKRMFDAAEREPRRSRDGGLRPFWVYEGRARIQRQLPILPLSQEVERIRDLKRSLAAYRMVFGQPRQEDLVEYLQDRVSNDELEHLAKNLRIDLRPPKRRGSSNR